MIAPANTLEVIRSSARTAWEEATDHWDYQFDAAGRMASGAQSIGGTQSTSNTYVGDQWYRVQSTTNGTTLKYGWKRDALFAEFNSSNDLVAGYLNDGVDQPLYKTRFSGNGATVDGRDFYHKDANWRVHHVTDGSGAISEKYVYNAYGKRTILDSGNGVLGASAIGNRIGFQGREHEDVESEAQEDGLTFHRWRFYDPDAGRWERRDPIGYRGGMNLFEAENCQPNVLIDRFGLFVGNFEEVPYRFDERSTEQLKKDLNEIRIRNNHLPNASGRGFTETIRENLDCDCVKMGSSVTEEDVKRNQDTPEACPRALSFTWFLTVRIVFARDQSPVPLELLQHEKNHVRHFSEKYKGLKNEMLKVEKDFSDSAFPVCVVMCEIKKAEFKDDFKKFKREEADHEGSWKGERDPEGNLNPEIIDKIPMEYLQGVFPKQ